MIDLLIRNADVMRIGKNTVTWQNGHDLAIRGNRIEAILPTGQIDTAQAQAILEAKGMIAMPGFVNGHCHAGMVLFRGLGEDIPIDKWFNEVIWPLEANLTPEDVYWGTQLALAEMIEAGVTTVADHYFHMDEVAKAVDQSGMRANLVWAAFSAGVPDPQAKFREMLGFVERWQGSADGRITTWLGPHAPYTCDELFLRYVAGEAKARGIGIHIHVSETQQQVDVSLAELGRTPIRVLQDAGVFDVPTILAHATHPSGDDIQIMARAGAGVIHCPKTFLKLAAGIAPIVEMRAAGIPVGIGSDGVVSNNTLDILEQTRLAAMLQKHERRDAEVLTIGDAFTMAFADGAHALQLDGLGDLAPGNLADLVLMRTDSPHMQPLLNPAANILYSAQASDVDTVICNGNILMHGRQLLTLDKAQIIEEVRARIGRLQKRTPGVRIQTYQM